MKTANKFLIPFIVVLLILPYHLNAGSETQLSIEKINQEILKGVLLKVDVEEKIIVVKTDNTAVKINMAEIIKIRYKQRSTFGKSTGMGFLIGVGIGAGLGYIGCGQECTIPRGLAALFGAAFFGGIGLVFGMLQSASNANYKTIRVKGRTPSEIKKILKKLKKKALLK